MRFHETDEGQRRLAEDAKVRAKTCKTPHPAFARILERAQANGSHQDADQCSGNPDIETPVPDSP